MRARSREPPSGRARAGAEHGKGSGASCLEAFVIAVEAAAITCPGAACSRVLHTAVQTMAGRMDRDTLLNWVGDPVGSAVEWIANNIARVSHHRTSTTVPDLNGMFVAEARSLLTRADLRLKVIEPAGLARVGQIVVRQDPPAGVIVRPKTRVTVHVEPPSTTDRPAYA